MVDSGRGVGEEKRPTHPLRCTEWPSKAEK
jgi:hypothetical protein